MRIPSRRVWSAVALAALWMTSVAAGVAHAQTFKVLVNFGGAEGEGPWAGLVQGLDGNLYGTTYQGGSNEICFNYYGCGTVFGITPSGKLTTLYTFCQQVGCSDGAAPQTPLIQATDGNLYGTTVMGGKSCYYGCGTIFRISAEGSLATLHAFDDSDGAGPYAPLVQGLDGNFYGTTAAGGAHEQGTVFKMSPTGTLTTLYSFCAQDHCRDGAEPTDGLVQATDGNFYGTAPTGGKNDSCLTNYGHCGLVFRITPAGELTIVCSFCSQANCADGAVPDGLILKRIT